MSSFFLFAAKPMAIFELLDAVLLQSLPVKNPQELAEVRIVDRDKARGSFSTGYPAVTNTIWEKLRDDHPGFSGIAAWRDTEFSRDSGGEARFLDGLWVERERLASVGVDIDAKDYCSTIISSLPFALANFASSQLASARLSDPTK